MDDRRPPEPTSRLHQLRGKLARLRPRRLRATWRWLGEIVASVRRRRGEARLTVAIDICPLWMPLTGIGWYLYQLLIHLADRDDVRVRLYGPWIATHEGLPEPQIPLPTGPALEYVCYRPPHELSMAPWRWVWLLQKLQKLLLRLERNDVLHAPNYLLPPHFRFARGVRVATIHDLGFVKVPETLKPSVLEELQGKLQRTFQRTAWVITDSHQVRHELAALGQIPAERIATAQLGSRSLAGDAETDARTGHDLDIDAALPLELHTPGGGVEPFALHVGTIEPRKNLGVLLDAWQRLPSRPRLVLCGGEGWKIEALLPRLQRAQEEGWLLRLGYTTDAQLLTLYRRARLVLFPTLYEGFGLPALEAQAAGAPLVCSDIPVLREVAGEGAVYVPASDADAWAQAVAQWFADTAEEARRQLAARGRTNVERFSWQRCADETLAVWRAAVDG